MLRFTSGDFWLPKPTPEKLFCVKRLKEVTGWGLKECKDAFDTWYATVFLVEHRGHVNTVKFGI